MEKRVASRSIYKNNSYNTYVKERVSIFMTEENNAVSCFNEGSPMHSFLTEQKKWVRKILPSSPPATMKEKLSKAGPKSVAKV